MNRLQRLWWAPIVLLAACGATGPVPEDRFYQLDMTLPTALETPALTGGLIIGRVDADPLRSGRAILYRHAQAPLELKRYRYEFWVDQPPKIIENTLLRYLRAAGVADLVQAHSGRADARYHLVTRLQRFEQLRYPAEGKDEVEVELEFTLYSQVSVGPVWRQVYRQRQATGEAGMHGSAVAMEVVLESIFERLARDLAALDVDT